MSWAAFLAGLGRPKRLERGRALCPSVESGGGVTAGAPGAERGLPGWPNKKAGGDDATAL